MERRAHRYFSFSWPKKGFLLESYIGPYIILPSTLYLHRPKIWESFQGEVSPSKEKAGLQSAGCMSSGDGAVAFWKNTSYMHLHQVLLCLSADMLFSLASATVFLVLLHLLSCSLNSWKSKMNCCSLATPTLDTKGIMWASAVRLICKSWNQYRMSSRCPSYVPMLPQNLVETIVTWPSNWSLWWQCCMKVKNKTGKEV